MIYTTDIYMYITEYTEVSCGKLCVLFLLLKKLNLLPSGFMATQIAAKNFSLRLGTSFHLPETCANSVKNLELCNIWKNLFRSERDQSLLKIKN